MSRVVAFTTVSDYFKSTLDKVIWNTDRDLVELLLLESDVAIEKNNTDIQKCHYDEYPNNFDQKNLEKELPLINKLKKRRILKDEILKHF